MSVVYSATHESLRTRHAVKVFDVPPCGNAALLRKKFLAEARILATLRHPNIVRVTDFGAGGRGRPYLVMDFIEGATLAERLSRSDAPSPDEATHIYRCLRSALACCHGKGIVHGDIKAENIIVGEDGNVFLSDFGIARILDFGLRKELSLSATSGVGNFGTAYTLAPECHKGASATPASDVYSFGVVMFKVVTGIWYEGSARLLGQLKSFAPEWEPLLRRMLAGDPRSRFPSAEALPENPSATCKGLGRLAASIAAVFASGGLLAGALFAFGGLRGGESEIRGKQPPPAGSTDGDMRIVSVPEGFDGVLLAPGEGAGGVRVVGLDGARVIYRKNGEVVVIRR